MGIVYDFDSARRRQVAERSYTATELREMAVGLGRLLATIEANEVTAHAGTVARLEGAISALEALANGSDLTGLVP
jgi:hypothetical protein